MSFGIGTKELSLSIEGGGPVWLGSPCKVGHELDACGRHSHNYCYHRICTTFGRALYPYCSKEKKQSQ
jgi:hypothetical protein